MICKNYNTGLVMSGGAVRGFAHVGVLQALNEHNIFPDIISGVSAGAIIGALYADGYTPRQILTLLWRRNIFRFVKLSPGTSGFLRINGLRKVLKESLHSKTFKQLPIPLIVTVTNVLTGKVEYISEGNLIDAILASASIPVLFKPYEMNGNTYIDGGMTDNLPVFPIKNRCNEIIGVHVNPVGKIEQVKGLINIALRAFHISVASHVDRKKELFKYFIEPLELRKYGYLDVKKGKEIFRVGYKKAMKVLDQDKTNIRQLPVA